MNYFIENRGPDLFRVELYLGDKMNGAILCDEASLDSFVFSDFGESGSIQMTQIFKRPISEGDIIDSFCDSMLYDFNYAIEVIKEIMPKDVH